MDNRIITLVNIDEDLLERQRLALWNMIDNDGKNSGKIELELIMGIAMMLDVWSDERAMEKEARNGFSLHMKPIDKTRNNKKGRVKKCSKCNGTGIISDGTHHVSFLSDESHVQNHKICKVCRGSGYAFVDKG